MADDANHMADIIKKGDKDKRKFKVIIKCRENKQTYITKKQKCESRRSSSRAQRKPPTSTTSTKAPHRKMPSPSGPSQFL